MRKLWKTIFPLLCIPLLLRCEIRAEWIASEHTRSSGSPYYIMVNRQMNAVTVYTIGNDGYYSQPFKAMVCSTGRNGHPTPLGTFTLTGYKSLWTHMIDGNWGQYASQFKGDYLFHSVCYTKNDPSTLMAEEYNMLGSPASRGCVRLQVADAKWIYDNCPAGTRVTIYDSPDADPLGKPSKFADTITPEQDNGWEPTDPREENPWQAWYVQTVRLDRAALSLKIGDKTELSAAVEPAGAFLPAAVWSSSDPSVASVSETGVVTGMDAGQAEISVGRDGARAVCIVRVTGRRLPFADVTPDKWYDQDVRYAYENKMISGTGNGLFLPDDPVRAAAIQVMYNLSGGSGGGTGAWYERAADWAARNGVMEQASLDGFDPMRPVTQREFAAMLLRCEALRLTGGAPSDAGGEGNALSHAVERGLFMEPDGDLPPDGTLTRAQMAALLRRCFLTEH